MHTNAKKQSSARLVQKKAKNDPAETSDFEEWKRAKQAVRPKDQLNLTETELKEVYTRVLISVNPQIKEHLVEFSYKEGCFVDTPQCTNMIIAYQLEGCLIDVESEEAHEQLIDMGIDPAEYIAEIRKVADAEVVAQVEEMLEDIEQETIAEEESMGEEAKLEGDEEEEEDQPKPKEEEQVEPEADEEEAEVETKVAAEPPKGKKKKLTNQFNFCERGSLTYNLPVRNQEVQTVPPPRANFSGTVFQWVIYDAYQQDYAAQQAEKELERERKESGKIAGLVKKPASRKTGERLGEAGQVRMGESWKVLERMTNQNTYYDITKDYRYWDDPADEFREAEGTLLPLWKFKYDKVKKNTVTSITWNPYYNDLFAASYGYLEFTKPIKAGAVCIFSLKNPSFPEYICMTRCAAMSVSIHPKCPYMVAVGLIDGNVLVYNVQQSCKIPAYTKYNVVEKHSGVVWAIEWGPDLPDGDLNFFSIGQDGRVNNWVLMQNTLVMTTVITLLTLDAPVDGPDGTKMKVRGIACCVAFHPKNPLMYLVGTEIGVVYECSVAYSSMYLFEYKGHHMPVFSIHYNKFNSDIFATCSADWKVKIWENRRAEALFVFDIGNSVADVEWAPYSSTVFAAVTTTGKVCVFDININKYKAICEQAVVSRRRCRTSTLAFNSKFPILLIGDDKGCVTTVKLSPNLRVMCKAPKKQPNLDQLTMQISKLDSLLALVREPAVLKPPPDTAGSED